MNKNQTSSWDSIHPASLSASDMHPKKNASSQGSAKPFRVATDPLFSFLKDYTEPTRTPKEIVKTETKKIEKPEKELKNVILPRRYVFSAKGGVVASDVLETKQEHEDEQEEKSGKDFKDDQQSFEIELPWSYSPSAEFKKVYGLSLRAQNGFYSPFLFTQDQKQEEKESEKTKNKKKNPSSLQKREQLENEHEQDEEGRGEKEEEEEEEAEAEAEAEAETSESHPQKRHFSQKQKERKDQELDKQIHRVGFVPILYKPLKAVVSDTTERPQLLKVAKHIGINLKNKKFSSLTSKETLLNQIYKTLMAQNKYYNNEEEVTDTFGRPILENYKKGAIASDPYTIKTIKKTTTTITRHQPLGFLPKMNTFYSTQTLLTRPVDPTTRESQKNSKRQFRLNSENEPPTDSVPAWFSHNSGGGVSDGPSSLARPTQALAYSSLFPPVSNPVGTYSTASGQSSTFANFLSSTPSFDQIRSRFNKATIQLFLTSPDFQILGMPDSITLLNLKRPQGEDSYGHLVRRVEKILEVGTKPVLSADEDNEADVDGDEKPAISGGIHIHKVFSDLMVPQNKKKGPRWQERRMKDMIRYRNMNAQLRTREMFNLVLNPTDENLVSLRDLLDTTPRNKFDMNLVLPQEYDGQNALMVAISAGDFYDENKNPLLAVLILLSAHFVSNNPSPLPPLNLNATDNSGYTALMHTTTLCYRIKQRIDEHVKMLDQLTEEEKETRQEIEPDATITDGSSRAMKLCHAIIFVLLNVEISVDNFLRHSSHSKSKISLFSISTMKKACKRNEYSVNPNMDVDGVTAAGIAVKHACILCLRMLQKYAPSLSLAKADQKTGRTPLHEAGRLCNALLFFLVLKSDVDYFALDNDKNTVFHTVARHDWDAWKRYWPDQAEAELWTAFNVQEEIFSPSEDSIMKLLWLSFQKFASSFAAIQYDMNQRKAKNQSFSSTQTLPSPDPREKEVLIIERNLIEDVIDRVNAEGVTILMMSALKRDLKSVEFELNVAHADPTVLSPTTCMRGSNKGCSILFMMTQLLNPDISADKKKDREKIIDLLENATKRVESTRNLMRRRWLESKIPHFQKPSTSSKTIPDTLGISDVIHPHLAKSSDTLREILGKIVKFIYDNTKNLGSKIVEFLYAYWNKEVGCNLKELDATEKKIYLANRRRLAYEKGIEDLSVLLEKFEMESNYSVELCQELEIYLKANVQIQNIFKENKPYQDLLEFHDKSKDATGSNSDDDDDDNDEDTF